MNQPVNCLGDRFFRFQTKSRKEPLVDKGPEFLQFCRILRKPGRRYVGVEFNPFYPLERDFPVAYEFGEKAFSLLHGRFGEQNAEAVLGKLPDQDPGRQCFANCRREFALELPDSSGHNFSAKYLPGFELNEAQGERGI